MQTSHLAPERFFIECGINLQVPRWNHWPFFSVHGKEGSWSTDRQQVHFATCISSWGGAGSVHSQALGHCGNCWLHTKEQDGKLGQPEYEPCPYWSDLALMVGLEVDFGDSQTNSPWTHRWSLETLWEIGQDLSADREAGENCFHFPSEICSWLYCLMSPWSSSQALPVTLSTQTNLCHPGRK